MAAWIRRLGHFMPATQKDAVVRMLDWKEKDQPVAKSAVTDEELKRATLCCISEIVEYFGRDAEVQRLWPNVGLALRCLSVDLQKLQRDERYQSRDFPMLNGEVQGTEADAKRKE